MYFMKSTKNNICWNNFQNTPPYSLTFYHKIIHLILREPFCSITFSNLQKSSNELFIEVEKDEK